jgi:hypothetical protein
MVPSEGVENNEIVATRTKPSFCVETAMMQVKRPPPHFVFRMMTRPLVVTTLGLLVVALSFASTGADQAALNPWEATEQQARGVWVVHGLQGGGGK